MVAIQFYSDGRLSTAVTGMACATARGAPLLCARRASARSAPIRAPSGLRVDLLPLDTNAHGTVQQVRHVESCVSRRLLNA